MARINKITRDGGRIEDLGKSIVAAIEKSPLFSGRSSQMSGKSESVLIEVKDKLGSMLDVSKKISETLNTSFEKIIKKINDGLNPINSINSENNSANAENPQSIPRSNASKKRNENSNEQNKKDDERIKKLGDIFKKGLDNLKEGIAENLAGENKSLGVLIGGLSGALGGYMVDTPKDIQKRNKAITVQAAEDAKNSETAKNEGISQTQASVVNALGGVNSKQGKAALQATDDSIIGAYSDSEIDGSSGDDIAIAALENFNKKKVEEPKTKKVEEEKRTEEPNKSKKVEEPKKKIDKQRLSEKKELKTLKEKSDKKQTIIAPLNSDQIFSENTPENNVKREEEKIKIEKAKMVKKSSGMKIGTIKETEEGVRYSYAGKNKNGEDVWKLPEEERKRLMEDHNKRLKDSIKETSGVNMDDWITAMKDGSFDEKYNKLSEDEQTKVTNASEAYGNGMKKYSDVLSVHKNKGIVFKSTKLKDVPPNETAIPSDQNSFDSLSKSEYNLNGVTYKLVEGSNAKYKGTDGSTREFGKRSDADEWFKRRGSSVTMPSVTTGSTLNANAMKIESQKSLGNTVSVNAPTTVSNQSMTANSNPPNANNYERSNSSFQGNGAIG